MTLHRCEPGYDVEAERYVFECCLFGQAITYCGENDKGALWAGNGEYITRVNFCPFCGYEARNKVDWEPTAPAPEAGREMLDKPGDLV